ncbi:MAG: YabP/YqfC family sporulation protein [Firmicutes bacterium]|jgi:hypothetical protein|nr:YabP/YqfC family sporulation protein [Bacillota bacterium]
MEYDLDFRVPRVTVTENRVILESVKEIVMISSAAVTVKNSDRYVTVGGENFVIREIGEGRLVIEGRVQRVEFL